MRMANIKVCPGHHLLPRHEGIGPELQSNNRLSDPGASARALWYPRISGSGQRRHRRRAGGGDGLAEPPLLPELCRDRLGHARRSRSRPLPCRSASRPTSSDPGRPAGGGVSRGQLTRETSRSISGNFLHSSGPWWPIPLPQSRSASDGLNVPRLRKWYPGAKRCLSCGVWRTARFVRRAANALTDTDRKAAACARCASGGSMPIASAGPHKRSMARDRAAYLPTFRRL